MSLISGTIGAILGSDSNKQAASTAQATQLSAQNQEEANFNTVQGQEAPYRSLGTTNLPGLQDMLSGNYNMQASPSATYAMNQGTKTINSNLQARGLEGNAVTQLGQLSSSTAASDYQTRFQDLLSATNIGSNAVAMTGSGANSLNANLQSGANTTSEIQAQTGMANSGVIGGAAGNVNGLGSKLLGNYISNLGNTGSTSTGSLGAMDATESGPIADDAVASL